MLVSPGNPGLVAMGSLSALAGVSDEGRDAIVGH
jgi:hypothetical protein